AVVWEPPKTSTPPIAKSPLMLTLLHTPSVLTRQLGRYPICPARVESYLSFFGPWLQRSGLQPVSEEVPGDDLALDLRCALVDPGSPDLPIEVLEQVPLLERPTLGRNRSSVRIASLKPPSTSPRTCCSDTNTPSSSSRPIGCAERRCRADPLRPLASPFTMKAVIPFVPAPVVVLAKIV